MHDRLTRDDPAVPPEEYVQRRREAAVAAERAGLDGLLVWGLGSASDRFQDIFYFTGHYSPMPWIAPVRDALSGLENHALVLTADARAVLCVCGFAGEAIAVDDVRVTFDLSRDLVLVLAELGLEEGRLGVVGSELVPFPIRDVLSASLPGLELEDGADLVLGLRQRLSDIDAQMIRAAAELGCSIFERVLDAVVVGGTEGHAVGAGLAEAARSDGCVHGGLLAASGPDAGWYLRRAMPPWNPAYVYRAGDVFHADLYGFLNGYAYDLQRTIELGRDTPAQARVSAAARATCDHLAEALVAGVTPGELHARGRECLAGLGMRFAGGGRETAVFGPSFGHLLGVGFLRPYFIPQGEDVNTPLEPPLALCFETFLTDGEGRFAGHEDMYLWSEDKVECLSR